LKALKLTENDLKASSRVCSFHFVGGERKKNDVPSLEIGKKNGAER
jgi:Fe-S cluster assembly ATPase SufC